MDVWLPAIVSGILSGVIGGAVGARITLTRTSVRQASRGDHSPNTASGRDTLS